VLATRNELIQANAELSQTRRSIAQLTESKAVKEQEIEQLHADLAKTKQDLEENFGRTEDLAERSRRVEKLHARHVSRLEKAEKQVHLLKESVFKESQSLFALRKTEASLISDISSAQGEVYSMCWTLESLHAVIGIK